MADSPDLLTFHWQEQELTEQIAALDKVREEHAKSRGDLNKKKTRVPDKLKEFAKARKKEEEGSLYSGIDPILQEYNIHRAQYYGGDFMREDIKKLMENANEIMEKIEVYLKENRSPRSSATDEEIKEWLLNGYGCHERSSG